MINFKPDVNLLDLLPDWYKSVLDYQQIAQAENGLYEIAADDLDTVHGNFFVANMTAEALAEWERVFNITSGSGENIAFRRDRIINRFQTRPPFTVTFLKGRLDELIGAGNYTITMDAANYTFYVDASAKDQHYAAEVTITINDIKPAHIVYINRPYLNDEINVSETVSASRLTYNYVLGSFGLGQLPFASNGAWEVKKMAGVPSVKPQLLEGAAEWLKSDIAKVLLNDSISVTSITKTRANSVLTVEYTVTTSMANTVTKIALLDSSNNMLTEADVYVPITQNTTFRHVLPITEG